MTEVWKKPSDGSYYFKKAHAIAYAHAVVLQMNLICEKLKMAKTYIHVNQHKIRANKKHGTNEPLLLLRKVRTILTSFSYKILVQYRVYGGNDNHYYGARVVIMTEGEVEIVD